MPATPFVNELTWDAVRDALASGAPAVLPIGAGSKQHGFHLPLGADARQAEWFAFEAAKRCGGLIWPTLTYGYYPAFAEYAGSVSLSRKTFEAVVGDVLGALLSQSKSAVLVIDLGVSTIESVAAAIGRFADPARVRHIPIYRGARFEAARRDLSEQGAGGHADEIETSILLAIAPKIVDMARAEASPPGSGAEAGPLSPSDRSSPNYAPSGSTGDPTLATAEKGRRLVAAILEDIDAVCADLGTL